MAHVMVPFANGKGGVGKTSLACSYAAARAHEGADVILIDTNEEQRTAMAWGAVRDHNSILPHVRVQGGSAREALEMIGRCEVLVVDTPGLIDKSTLLLARQSTFTVVPTGPNPTYELEATVNLLHGLRREGIEQWRLGIVLSRFSGEDKARRDEEELARAYLAAAEGKFTALPGVVRNSTIYGAALAEGYGLTEVERSRSLADEAAAMMQTISKGVSMAWQRKARNREEVAGMGRPRDKDRNR